MSTRFQADLKAAMKAGEGEKVSTLRMLLSALQYEAVAKGKALEEADVLTILQREVKKRHEAAEAFRAGGREEEARKEEREAALLQAYLPQPLGEAELRAAIEAVIAEKGISGKAQTGLLMKEIMTRYKGRVDGKKAQALVAELLQ